MSAESMPVPHYTVQEYLERERQAEFKSEYLNGMVYAMSGGTPTHSTIAVNICSEIKTRLRGTGCRAYNSDLQIGAGPIEFLAYPDVSIVCGDLEFLTGRRDVVTNPVLIVEVLSARTAGYDRETKFFHYRQIETFREYLLVSQEEPAIDRFRRTPDGEWRLDSVRGVDAILDLASIGCALALADVYEGVTFSGAPPGE